MLVHAAAGCPHCNLPSAASHNSGACPLCRAAFAFVYKERVPQPQRRPLAWLLGGAQGATAEFPATDMRALDGLERILRRAGVLNE